MKKSLSVVILSAVITSTTAQISPVPKTPPHHPAEKKSPPVKHQLIYKIINSDQNTFGYDILDNNRLMIHQPAMPAVPGNKGFATKEDAAKVAKLVIKKINKNILPPSVTPQELNNLKIKL